MIGRLMELQPMATKVVLGMMTLNKLADSFIVG